MQIRKVHNTKDKDSFGSPRIYQELKKMGIPCSENTVAKIMKEAGIQAKTTKKFKMTTTDSNHDFPVAKNILNREFDRATGPNQIWVSDITYVWTEQGWLYLACVMDLFSRKVVGWSMAPRMTKKLVLDAMNMALIQRCPGEGLLHHSDRGSQYCSKAYRKLLAENGITCSMSRRGNCWDNAAMESFFGTLKKERVHHERYKTRAEARNSIFEYIEIFYNRERIHSTLGYLSPDDFEQAT
jgi:transposase InsO family protein